MYDIDWLIGFFRRIGSVLVIKLITYTMFTMCYKIYVLRDKEIEKNGKCVTVMCNLF